MRVGHIEFETARHVGFDLRALHACMPGAHAAVYTGCIKQTRIATNILSVTVNI